MPAPFGGMSGRMPAARQMSNPVSGYVAPMGSVSPPPSGPRQPPRRRGLMNYLRGALGDVGQSIGSVTDAVARSPEAQSYLRVENAMRDQARNNDLRTGLLQALAPYVDVARSGMDLDEAGRIAEDRRTEFLRNAYENYGNPTEGYYALPRVMGSGGVDPNMFTGHDQAAIDNARRKFMSTHAWARKKKHSADVDVAVKYLLDKGHKFYT